MNLSDGSVQQRLARWLMGWSGCSRPPTLAAEKLSGGAIQENWRLHLQFGDGAWAGAQSFVLRTDAAVAIAASRSRAQEYAILRTAHRAGVVVPEPLALCEDRSVLGRSFFLMRALPGIAAGHRLSRDESLVPDRAQLAHDLGRSLAFCHSVSPPQSSLSFLSGPSPHPVQSAIAGYREFLDTLAEKFPTLEWGLAWCLRHAPVPLQPCLIHRDYRTGNYLVHEGRLSGVLDWEFADWGDAREDFGWFTARCWRFAAPQREAGGIGPLSAFVEGYASATANVPDLSDLRYWQVLAHLRWAIIALQQGRRSGGGQPLSLELTLTTRLVAELAQQVLQLIREIET